MPPIEAEIPQLVKLCAIGHAGRGRIGADLVMRVFQAKGMANLEDEADEIIAARLEAGQIGGGTGFPVDDGSPLLAGNGPNILARRHREPQAADIRRIRRRQDDIGIRLAGGLEKGDVADFAQHLQRLGEGGMFGGRGVGGDRGAAEIKHFILTVGACDPDSQPDACCGVAPVAAPQKAVDRGGTRGRGGNGIGKCHDNLRNMLPKIAAQKAGSGAAWAGPRGCDPRLPSVLQAQVWRGKLYRGWV